MTASLEDRVAVVIADHPGSTLAEVASRIRRRKDDIRRVLNSGAYNVALDSNGRKHYFMPFAARDRLGPASTTAVLGEVDVAPGGVSGASTSPNPDAVTPEAAPGSLPAAPQGPSPAGVPPSPQVTPAVETAGQLQLVPTPSTQKGAYA